MIFKRNILIVLSLSLFLIACNESAASKIKADNQSNAQAQPSYAEITFDKIYHDFGNVKEGGRIDTLKLVEIYRKYLQENNWIRFENFNHNNIKFKDQTIQ